jgi:hypothetical protein
VKRKWFTWRRLVWIAGAGLLVWLIVGVILAGKDTPEIPPTSQAIDLKGGHITGNRITTKSWSFDYQHAQLSPDGTTGTVDGVRNGIVFKKGKPYLRISAEHISINTQSLDFTAIGKVHVERVDDPEKRSFDTDLVVWTNNAKIVRLDHPSYVHTKDNTLRLESVTINFDTDQIHFGQIGGKFELKK